MVWRPSHGDQKGTGPRVETLKFSELPDGIPDPTPPLPPIPAGQNPHTLVAGSERARAIARMGGKARMEQKRQLAMITGLGLGKKSPLLNDETTRAYALDALEFVKLECARLAADHGGGFCSPSATACLQAAARAMLFSRLAADNLDGAKSCMFDDKMKQQLSCAIEICVRDAKARGQKGKKMGVKERLRRKLESGE